MTLDRIAGAVASLLAVEAVGLWAQPAGRLRGLINDGLLISGDEPLP